MRISVCAQRWHQTGINPLFLDETWFIMVLDARLLEVRLDDLVGFVLPEPMASEAKPRIATHWRQTSS
jgi:hypothetical protein